MSSRTSAAHIEPAAIPLWREEHEIVTALDHFGKVRIELYDRATASELRAAEILEPVLRALHAMKNALRSVGKRHHSVLHGRGNRAIGVDIAIENASKGCCAIVRNAEDAVAIGGIAEDTYVRVRCANHAMYAV